MCLNKLPRRDFVPFQTKVYAQLSWFTSMQYPNTTPTASLKCIVIVDR